MKINKKIIQDKTLSNDAIVSFVGLSMISLPDINTYTSVDIISYYLTNNPKPNRKIKDTVRNGLNELIDKKIVICNGRVKNNSVYYIDSKNILVTKNYITLQQEEIWKILNLNINYSTALLRFYMNLLCTFIVKNNIKDIREPKLYDNKFGMLSINSLCNLTGISNSTAIKYINTLEEIKLLYVVRCSKNFRHENGTIKRHNNIYGKYEDSKIINQYAAIEFKDLNDLKNKQIIEKTNNSRSMLQKYNSLVKGKEYDQYTITALFEFIVQYNNSHPGKERDLDVFEKYGFDININKKN
jgi:hypothetical protein